MMDWDALQKEWQANAVDTDKEDLLGLLALRFGDVPDVVEELIRQIEDSSALERLILVAANVPTWTTFMEELKESGTAFRIVGERYHPI